MNKEALIKKIREKAKADRKRRRDPRFLGAMGFLVAKGFLQTNLEVPLLPNKRLRIAEVIWAGKNVEPRILEVLPAAILRLGKHFDLDPQRYPELTLIVDQLRKGELRGAAFYGIPFEKVKFWKELPLRDGRVKLFTKKKVLKTFRLDPSAIVRLRNIAEEKNCSETEVLEQLLLG